MTGYMRTLYLHFRATAQNGLFNPFSDCAARDVRWASKGRKHRLKTCRNRQNSMYMLLT